MNLSHSKQTREIFFQLFVVSGIVFTLIYLDNGRKKISALLTYLLVVEGIFLSLIGGRSVVEYMAFAGLTFKRLYGITGILWLVSVYALFLFSYLRYMSSGSFVRSVFILTASTLLAINIANFDRLISEVNQARSYMGIDYQYIADTVSADAGNRFELLKKMKDTPGVSGWRLAHALRETKDSYSPYISYRPGWRGFHAATYQEYQTVKDEDIEMYRPSLIQTTPQPSL